MDWAERHGSILWVCYLNSSNYLLTFSMRRYYISFVAFCFQAVVCDYKVYFICLEILRFILFILIADKTCGSAELEQWLL